MIIFAAMITSEKKEKPVMQEAKPLQKMFNKVPRRYDMMNRIFTLGLDEFWRKKATRIILDRKPQNILDICTGTGDLIIRLASRTMDYTEMYALDFSEPMLEVAREKAEKAKVKDINFVVGDVGGIPFPDNYFDMISNAFGFRNLTYKNPGRSKYLDEIFRVLKQGGSFAVIETCQPPNQLLKSLFHFYLRTAVKYLAGFISGQKAAYSYLARSAANFYNANELNALLKEHGFTPQKTIMLAGGIAAIYLAKK